MATKECKRCKKQEKHIQKLNQTLISLYNRLENYQEQSEEIRTKLKRMINCNC